MPIFGVSSSSDVHGPVIYGFTQSNLPWLPLFNLTSGCANILTAWIIHPSRTSKQVRPSGLPFGVSEQGRKPSITCQMTIVFNNDFPSP